MNVQMFIKKYGRIVLGVLSSVGVVWTAYESAKAAPKALKEIEETHAETIQEKVLAGGKHYIKTGAVGAGTIGCIAAQTILGEKNTAALVAVGTAAIKKYDEYRKTNIEVNGKEADSRVMGRLIHRPDFVAIEDINAPDQVFLFYDPVSDLIFQRTEKAFLNAQLHLNRNIHHPWKGCATYGEFLELFGVPEEDIPKHAYNIGWSAWQLAEQYEAGNVDFYYQIHETDGHGDTIYEICCEFPPTPDYLGD